MISSNCKILVVDDKSSVFTLLITKLQSFGFAVVCVENGFDAIQKLNREPFDLVLTDLGQSGINGNVLAQYLRNMTRDVAVFAVTGQPWLAGDYFDSVIETPFELTFVMDTIEYYFMENKATPMQQEMRLWRQRVESPEGLATFFSKNFSAEGLV